MRIDHVAITVSDIDKVSSFYKELFAMEEVRRYAKEGGYPKIVLLAGAGGRIEFISFGFPKEAHPMELQTQGINHLGVEVEKIEPLLIQAKKLGGTAGTIEEGTKVSRYAFIRDPEGNQIEVYEP